MNGNQTSIISTSQSSPSPTDSATIPSAQWNNPEYTTTGYSEEIIRKFTNSSDQNLRFKGITNETYADLYVFESGNSSFWVNNITGRVQSAVWIERGSKNQKEIIDLDQGSAIAESYAKEKCPELWNVSNTKGIKQTVKRINDRGGDRVFEYLWQEILYNPDNTTVPYLEIPDGNSVSIDISPYTGHITGYVAWYFPPNSSVNLTPTLTEEEARQYAESYFRGAGFENITPDQITHPVLSMVNDEHNHQHLSWSFILSRKTKNGFDEGGFVGIDAHNGRVVWHASIL